MKDYLLLFTKEEKLKRNITSFEYYEDEVKSTTSGEKSLVFKMKDQIIDIEMGDKIGIFLEGKFDLFIVDQIESETYYSTDIKVTCLHDFYSIQEQKAITQYHSENATLREAITEILKGTEYVLGTCPERAIKPIGPYLYKNPLWCIQDIVSNFNVEIDYSIELNENRNGIHRKVLNVVNSLGSDTGIRCSTDLNVSKIRKVQKKKFYTVMYGCGAEYQKDLVKYKYDFKDAVWETPNHPANKPKGQEFIEDKKAIAKYGRKIGIYEDGRIKDPELLLKKTWEALQQNNKPFVSYELDIEELKTEDGYEHLNFKLGDIIILQNTIDNSRAKFRIVEDYKSIRDKNKRKIVVGEQIRGIFSGGDSSNSDGTEGPGGSVIEPGEGVDTNSPNIEEILPDTLPEVPILTAKGLWKDVQLSWSYENKIYYDYEVYASKVKDFEPTVFHMIYSGKASAFLHEAGANETWYYRVRAVNSFGNATQFSEQVEVHTTKVSDGTEYFESAAIKDALIEELRLDRGWIGTLRGHYIDARELSVTDGNNNKTLYIDSFGNITADFTSLTLRSSRVETEEGVQDKINKMKIGTRNLVLNSNRYIDNSQGTYLEFNLVVDAIKMAIGKTIALSVDIELTDVIGIEEGRKRVGIEFWIRHTDGTYTYYGVWHPINDIAQNLNERFSNIVDLSEKPIESVGNLGIYIQGLTSGTARLGRPKVEISTKVSDYSLAFEDTEVSITNVYNKVDEVEQLTTPDRIVETVKEHKTNGIDTFVTGTKFEQTKDDFLYKFENSGKPNELINSDFSEVNRGWTIYQEGNTGAFVEYSDGFNGVEPVGTYCMTIHNANAVGGYGYAMQKFKPRNPRMINFTVGGCYHYDDIRVWTEEPYPLAYIYVVVVNKDGTREYYNQDEVMRNNQYIGWQTYSKTFGRIGKEIDWVEFYVFKRSTTGTFRITNLDFHEGTEHRKWRPSGEIYSNTTKIDGEGIEIIHNNGSKSRFSHEKIEFTAPNGNATLRIKDGGLNMFTATNNEMCGFVKPSQIKQDWYNGVSISTYASGDYITLGHSTSTDETTWSSLPSILIAKHDNFDQGNYWEGINFVNQKVLLRTRTHLKNILDIDPVGRIELYANSNTPHLIYNSTDNRLCFMGDNELVLGIREGEFNRTILKIIESPYERIQNYHHWNFNNWTMWNMQTAHTLSAQSKQLRAKTKDINDIYGVYSMTDGEIRYTCRETQSIGNTGVNLESRTIQEDRTLLVELPQILAENIESDYHINIGKISWGDYRIVEKTPYYFVIESNVDNFQFTYEIVGKQLFNKTRNAIIASNQYGYNDAPEDVEDAKVVFEEDNGQIGAGSFWKIYTNEFLRANINNKTLKFTSPR